jgi:hypothetical protein
VVAGASVGGILGAFVVRQYGERNLLRSELRAGATGAIAGAIMAPLAVLAYILTWRVILALELMFFDRRGFARRLEAFIDPSSLDVYVPTHAWYETAFRVALNISTMWFSIPVAQIIVGFVLAATLVLGVRWKHWWPLGTVAAALLFGLVGPLIRDMRDLLRLPFMAAIVWVVPAAVLGLAAPLLERPAERSKWWSSIAAALGIAVAMLTVVRLHDARYLLLALALFVVAGLFVIRSNIEEFWPALALCLAILVTGLSFAVVHLTASFHEVLAGVSRVNAVPARVDTWWRAKQWTDDVRTLDETAAAGAGGWYGRQLIERYANAKVDERLAILDEAKARIVEDRPAAFERLHTLAREKQRALLNELGDEATGNEFYHSLDGIGTASDEEFWRTLASEYFDAHDWAGTPFWKRYAEQIDELKARFAALDALAKGLPALRAEAVRQAGRDEAQRRWTEKGVTQKLEVALAGSTAFWVTVGLLAAWGFRRGMVGSES